MDKNFCINLDEEEPKEKQKPRFNGVEVVPPPEKKKKKNKTLYTFLDMDLIKNFRSKKIYHTNLYNDRNSKK